MSSASAIGSAEMAVPATMRPGRIDVAGVRQVPGRHCLGNRDLRPRAGARRRCQVALITVGAASALVVLNHRSIQAVVGGSLGATRAAWLLLAVVLHVGSMASFGVVQRGVLAAVGLRLPFRSALAIVYAGNAVAVTVPFAGATAGAAYTYRQYLQRGATGPMAGWAMAVAGVLSTSAFAAIIGLGAVVNGRPVVAIAGLVTVLATAVPVVAVIVAVGRPTLRAHLKRAVIRLLSLFQRIVRRPRRPPAELVTQGFAQLSAFRVGGRQVAVGLAFAGLNWLLDALCLWAVLQAFDVAVAGRDLLLLYGAVVAAASLGLTPAGIGTVESTIALALVKLGSGATHALTAAVVYRAISTWLAIAVGWTILVTLKRRTTGRARAPKRGRTIPPRRTGAAGDLVSTTTSSTFAEAHP